jgi:hypothetical protein
MASPRIPLPVLASLAALLAAPAARAATLESPFVPAGSQAAPLRPDEDRSAWRLSLATGVAGRAGGLRIAAARENPALLLFFAGQADGAWSRTHGLAARLRFRLFTGGERDIYGPSDGEVEAAFALGRREFRLVLARVEAGRYPALGVQALVQAATLPSFEGTLPFVDEAIRLQYSLSPVEAAFVRYHGPRHLPGAPGWASESDRAVAASTARLRYAVVFWPELTFTAQGEVVKLWRKGDLLAAVEAGVGWQVFERTTLFSFAARWNGYTRRGPSPGSTDTASELLLVAGATLAL